MDFIIDNGFMQFVTEPTRKDNTLDLLFCNDYFLLSHVNVIEPFGSSDHNAVEFGVLVDVDELGQNNDVHIKQYLWSQGDYESMAAYLNAVNWDDLLTVNFTANALWAEFSTILNNAVDLFVPSKLVTPHNAFKRRNYPKHVRVLINRKRAIWKLMKKFPSSPSIRIKYNRLSAECRLAIRRYERSMENKVIESNNLGAFYRFVNSRSSRRSGVGPLVGPNGKIVTSDKEKADLLNKFFGSVCVKDDGHRPHINVSHLQATDDLLSNIVFTANNVFRAACRVKTKSKLSCDPDGYPVLMLQKLRSVLCQPLSLFYNSFMSIGQIPDVWKTAVVTPVYKKGPSSDPANYRPISQTSIFCKLMERVIVAEMGQFMRSRNIISKQQHGFINKCSTTTNLLESLNDWSLAIDNKLTETVAYIDFARAFDTVSHEKLKLKLQANGIGGELLSLIMNFLQNRVQVTKVGDQLSDSVSVTSGVIQGSCLGPLLFVIYINDLAMIFDPCVTPKFYADDLKLYANLKCSALQTLFQDSLDKLTHWAKDWQLSISIQKCCVMRVASRRAQEDVPPRDFMLCDHVLSFVDVVRDLGVSVDCHLTFSAHVTAIVQKASQRTYLILRSFYSRDRTVLTRAFTAYVRPILETNSQVWSPHLLTDIRRIEAVQRRFTKKLNGLSSLSYSERLRLLGLATLEERRIRADLIFTYKLLFGMTSLNINEFFTLCPSTVTRGHQFKLFLPRASCDVRKYFFSSRVVHVWNDLPITTNFESIRAFVRDIDSLNLLSYCRCLD